MILNVVVAAAGLQLFRSVEARSDALWSGSGSGSGGGGVVGGFHCFASTATKKFPLSLTSRSFKRGWDANHDYRKSAECSFVVGLAIQLFTPTTTIASLRQGTWLTRPDPWPQIEISLYWVPD